MCHLTELYNHGRTTGNNASRTVIPRFLIQRNILEYFPTERIGLTLNLQLRLNRVDYNPMYVYEKFLSWDYSLNDDYTLHRERERVADVE